MTSSQSGMITRSQASPGCSSGGSTAQVCALQAAVRVPPVCHAPAMMTTIQCALCCPEACPQMPCSSHSGAGALPRGRMQAGHRSQYRQSIQTHIPQPLQWCASQSHTPPQALHSAHQHSLMRRHDTWRPVGTRHNHSTCVSTSSQRSTACRHSTWRHGSTARHVHRSL